MKKKNNLLYSSKSKHANDVHGIARSISKMYMFLIIEIAQNLAYCTSRGIIHIQVHASPDSKIYLSFKLKHFYLPSKLEIGLNGMEIEIPTRYSGILTQEWQKTVSCCIVKDFFPIGIYL